MQRLASSPNRAPYFSCNNQPLKIEEQVPWQPAIFNCIRCNDYGKHSALTEDGPEACSHGERRIRLRTINPKYPNPVELVGGSFISGPAMFVVTDDLSVKPLSPMSGISLVSKLGISISDLEEHVVSVGKDEVKQNDPVHVTSVSTCNMVMAALISLQGCTEQEKFLISGLNIPGCLVIGPVFMPSSPMEPMN